MWHRGPKPVVCHFWLFYLIIFYTASASKYFLQNENILVLTEDILVWLEQSKKLKKSINKFMVFGVIIILCNHYFIILKLLWSIKFFILNQIKQTALKSGYNFTTYDKITDTSWNEELQTWKPLSSIWAYCSISRKRQTTGFEPLRHKWLNYKTITTINFKESMQQMTQM